MNRILKILGVIVFCSSILLLSLPSHAYKGKFKKAVQARKVSRSIASRVGRNAKEAQMAHIGKQATKKVELGNLPKGNYKAIGGNSQIHFPNKGINKKKATPNKKFENLKDSQTGDNVSKPKTNTPKKKGSNSKITKKKGKQEGNGIGPKKTRGPPSNISGITPSHQASLGYKSTQLKEFKYANEYGILDYRTMQSRLKYEVKAGKLSYDEVGVYSTRKMELDVPQHGGIIMTHQEYDTHMKSVVATWKPKKHTKANYRHNLSVFTGDAGGGKDAHHVFPQKGDIADKIRKEIDNIHDPKYMTWWKKSEHRSLAKQYNEEWEEFLKSTPTKDKILDFARSQNEKYTLQSNF